MSLEAIFLSTFVMIGHRQAEFQQADHDCTQQELELKTNTELTCEIHRLTIVCELCVPRISSMALASRVALPAVPPR